MENETANNLSRRMVGIVAEHGSLCCGLDPDHRKLPAEFRSMSSVDLAVDRFLKEVIEITAPFVCAYKLQKAFFDLLEEPRKVLISIVTHIKDIAKKPVILDLKMGDTGNTMIAYLEYCRSIGVDAALVNPYMGDDVLDCFNDRRDLCGIVLARSSNEGARLLQDQFLFDGRTVWEAILDEVSSRWIAGANLIPVLSSTIDISQNGGFHKIPLGLPIFVAGYGAQGGTLENIRKLAQDRKHTLIVTSSRQIVFPFDASSSDWRGAVANAAKKAQVDLRKIQHDA